MILSIGLFRVNNAAVQTIEMFEGMPFINFKNQPCRDFMYIVSGTKKR